MGIVCVKEGLSECNGDCRSKRGIVGRKEGLLE